MKNTKKNGVKRNKVLMFAVLGLLIGAGATGALASGVVPNLDTGVSGSVSATVSDSPLLTISSADSGFTGYTSGSGSTVKFSEDISIAAPGYATVNITVDVKRVVDSANGVLVSMDGLGDYVKVNLTTGSGTASRIANGEWILSTGSTLTTTDSFALTFTIYVSQYNSGTSASMDNIWDFSISEVNA